MVSIQLYSCSIPEREREKKEKKSVVFKKFYMANISMQTDI